MKKNSSIGLAMVTGVVLLSGCVTEPPFDPPYPPTRSYPSQSQYPSQQYPSNNYPAQTYQQQGTYYGIVDRIEVINRGDTSNVAGMVIGGIVAVSSEARSVAARAIPWRRLRAWRAAHMPETRSRDGNAPRMNHCAWWYAWKTAPTRR